LPCQSLEKKTAKTAKDCASLSTTKTANAAKLTAQLGAKDCTA
jgi:hypothetical protein